MRELCKSEALAITTLLSIVTLYILYSRQMGKIDPGFPWQASFLP